MLERLNGDLPSFRSDKRSPIERRPPLNRVYVSKYAAALRATLGWKNLTTRGRETRHCRRLRDVTPQRLVCALVEGLGAWRVETVADILRTFNAQTGLNTRYKAFYNRLAQPEFPRFMRQVFRDILKNLSAQVLRPAAGGKLTHFEDLVVQDGSSFAVHDVLARTYPARSPPLGAPRVPPARTDSAPHRRLPERQRRTRSSATRTAMRPHALRPGVRRCQGLSTKL